MAILENTPLQINGETIAYEGNVKPIIGSKTRKPNPQLFGNLIYTTDNSTNFTTLKVSIRNTPASIEQFKGYYRNGDNNVISFGNLTITNVAMEVLPETEDQGLTEYTFFGDAGNI